MDFSLISPDVLDVVLLYLPRLAAAILLLIVGFWIAGRLGTVIQNRLTRNKVDPTVGPFLRSMVVTGFRIIVILAVASMLGIETTSFLAIFSALAFAIGLALSGTLGHFASGVLLLIFRPYKVGDLVTLAGGQTGTVTEIEVFNTMLQTLDNKRVIIPNSEVTSNIITNISGQEIQGVEMTFGIGYGDDIDRARDIILRVGRECPQILSEPAQGVVVSSLGDSSVKLATRPFVKSGDYWDAFFYMNEHVKKAFDAEGIRVPYPQMNIQLNQAVSS